MLYISSACIKKKYIKDSVEELALAGFKCIELSGGTTYYQSYMEDLLALKERYGLNYQVHNYFPPPEKDFVLNFTSEDHDSYLESRKLIMAAVDAVNVLGAIVYGFHPGYTIEMSPEKRGGYFDYSGNEACDKATKEIVFFERFDKLLHELANNIPPIAMENLFPFSEKEDFSLFSHPDEILRFLEYYSECPGVGLLLDLGHLNVSSYYLGFDKYMFLENLFEKYPHKIFQIHLSDNDQTADQHRVTSEGSWQVALLKKNIDIISEIPVSLEWLSAENTSDYFDRYQKIHNIIY